MFLKFLYFIAFFWFLIAFALLLRHRQKKQAIRRPPGPESKSWLVGLGKEMSEVPVRTLYFEKVAREFGDFVYVDLGLLGGIYVVSTPRLVKQLTQSAKEFGVVSSFFNDILNSLFFLSNLHFS